MFTSGVHFGHGSGEFDVRAHTKALGLVCAGCHVCVRAQFDRRAPKPETWRAATFPAWCRTSGTRTLSTQSTKPNLQAWACKLSLQVYTCNHGERGSAASPPAQSGGAAAAGAASAAADSGAAAARPGERHDARACSGREHRADQPSPAAAGKARLHRGGARAGPRPGAVVALGTRGLARAAPGATGPGDARAAGRD